MKSSSSSSASTTAARTSTSSSSGLRGCPLVSITHGGGPMPLLGSQDDLVEIWSKHVDRYIAPARPDAVVIISAHYHGKSPRVLAVERPKMIFDYGGFPPEAYRYQYPAKGHPALARKIFSEMTKIPILADAVLDEEWGFDHGTFVPLMKMFPHAAIPVVAVSVSADDDAAVQLAIGEAIRNALLPPSQPASAAKDGDGNTDDDATQRCGGVGGGGSDQVKACKGGEGASASNNVPSNVAVIASGSEFHNFGYIMGPNRGRKIDPSFNAHLARLLTDKSMTPEQRREGLLKWRSIPGSEVYQPKKDGADHLMPLLSLAAVAGYAPASTTVAYNVFAAESTDFIWKSSS